LLDEASIRRAISAGALGRLESLAIHHTIDSTNAQLRRQGVGGSGAAVCLAESQSAGRGRRGRAWVSPFASSIYMSVGWRFEGGAEVLEGLSLAVGVVVCEVLTGLGAEGLSLKWPNDVYLQGRKLAGILLEMSGDFSGPCDAVIGIGINVTIPDSQAQHIEQSWSDLRSIQNTAFSRSLLVGRLIDRLLPTLAGFEQAGFAAWRERWLALDAFADQPVVIDNNGRRMAGAARGVDDRGALLLETSSGMQVIHGGEVSLRRAETAV
jgi:BirA family biotin operon repressor/biotin-[acetyl-CoA-carboxylase] ligase